MISSMTGTTATTEACDCGALLDRAADLDGVALRQALPARFSIAGSSPATTAGRQLARRPRRPARSGSAPGRGARSAGSPGSYSNEANWLSGTVRPLGSGTCRVGRVESETRCSSVARATHVDEIDVVADLRHRRAGDHRVEHAGQRLGAQAEQARLVLVDRGCAPRASARPSRSWSCSVSGLGRHDLRADRARSSAPPTGRARSPGTAPASRPAARARAARRGRPRSGTPRPASARAWPAGGRAPPRPWRRSPPGRRTGWPAARRAAGRSGSRRGRHRCSSARRRDRPRAPRRTGSASVSLAKIEAFCGRREVDQQLGPVGGREELPRDQRQQQDRADEHGKRDQRCVSQRARSATARKARYQRTTRGGSGGGPGFGTFRMNRLEQRREDHRHQPRHQQGDGDDGEQGEAVLAGAELAREADRHEARDRHQRAGEHRHGVGLEGVHRRPSACRRRRPAGSASRRSWSSRRRPSAPGR